MKIKTYYFDLYITIQTYYYQRTLTADIVRIVDEFVLNIIY